MNARQTKTRITKDWCVKMAQLEGDSEIGAGAVAVDPIPSSRALKARMRRDMAKIEKFPWENK